MTIADVAINLHNMVNPIDESQLGGGGHSLKFDGRVAWPRWPLFSTRFHFDSHFSTRSPNDLVFKIFTNFQLSLTIMTPFLTRFRQNFHFFLKFLSKMCPNLYFAWQVARNSLIPIVRFPFVVFSLNDPLLSHRKTPSFDRAENVSQITNEL